jgi:hypothetical protein
MSEDRFHDMLDLGHAGEFARGAAELQDVADGERHVEFGREFGCEVDGLVRGVRSVGRDEDMGLHGWFPPVCGAGPGV